jgi:hypothetical protein
MLAFKKREEIRNIENIGKIPHIDAKFKKPLHWIKGTECSENKWSHLACFSAGNMALGAYYLNNYSVPKPTLP